MKLSYARIELLVTAMHGVHARRQGALSAKFKHLRRLGIPPGINVGRENNFAYDLEATILTTFAFDLLQSLLLPQAAATLILEHRAQILGAVHAVAVQQGRSEAVDAKSPICATSATRCIVLLPTANADWTHAPVVGEPPHRAALPAGLEVARIGDIAELLVDPARPSSAVMVMDVFGMVRKVRSLLTRADWVTSEVLDKEFARLPRLPD